MGSPLELRTVVSSGRGAARKYETGESAPSIWAKLGVGAIVLAAMTLAKKLLFPSPALSDGPDADALDDGSREIAALEDRNTDGESVAGEAQEKESDSNSPQTSPAMRARGGASASEAPLEMAEAGSTPAALNGGLHVIAARASNDNVVAPPPASSSKPLTAAQHAAASIGSVADGRSDPRERDQAPVISRSASLRSISGSQAMLISLADLLQGVSDPDGDALSIGAITSSSGHVVANDDGTWTFTPETGQSGEVVLAYEVTDGQITVLQTAKIATVPATTGEVVTGTTASEHIVTQELAYSVSADAGNDMAYTAAGADRIKGGPGNDILFGGEGDDVILAGSGDDFVSGGAGNDQIKGEAGDDHLFGDLGDDIIDGGAGNDVFLASIGDTGAASTATSRLSDGNDVIDGGEGYDTYDAAATTSSMTIDLTLGTANGEDIGQDSLSGIENVVCGSGEDVIVDSASRNVLTGGSGDDIFCFTGLDGNPPAGDEKYDQITDFETGDKIDISRIDADKSSLVSDGFEFLGELTANSSNLLALKQLGFRFEVLDDGEHTLVYGRTSEFSDHDFAVDLAGHHDLTRDDFIGLAS